MVIMVNCPSLGYFTNIYACKELGSERLHDVTSHVKLRLNLAPYADVNVAASISRRN